VYCVLSVLCTVGSEWLSCQWWQHAHC